MMKAINFLIEVSLLQCILFLVYQFLFSNQTDFKWNRKFLLTTTLLTWLIPFLNIDLFFAQQAIITLPDNIKTYWLSDVDVSSAAEKTYLFNFEIILKFIYFSIIIFFTINIGKQLIDIFTLRKKAKATIQNDYMVFEHPQIVNSFSFLKWIFVPNDLHNREVVIQHEIIHIRKKHSIDRIILALNKVVFWFNPAVYAIEKRMIEVHEFEADENIASSIGKENYCGLLAKTALIQSGFSLANHFYHSFTLKRITMIKKVKNSTSYWRQATAILILAFSGVFIACQDAVMDSVQEIAKTSSITTTYPQKVQQAVDKIKAKNSQIEVIVFGVADSKNETFKNMMATIEVNSIQSIEIIKIDPNEKADFPNYIIIEKKLATQYAEQITEQSEDGSEIFTIVEETATPTNGMDGFYTFIKTNLSYPQTARDKRTEGKVFVQFIINEDGRLSDVTVIKGLGDGCDEEAIRVVGLSPNWKPGKQKGIPLKQRMVLPITFKL
ncbi:MAG: TonB family protein [Chryseotalea sp.]